MNHERRSDGYVPCGRPTECLLFRPDIDVDFDTLVEASGLKRKNMFVEAKIANVSRPN